jgi:membrane protease YdiL (CAAX protease family)
MKRSLSAHEKPSSWWKSKHIIWLEFALFSAVYIADWKHHILLSKVPYLFLLGWLSLRLRGMRWRDVGLGLYEGWGRSLLIGILSGVGIEIMELFCTQPLLAHLTGQMPDLSAFDRVTGNVKWLLISLAFTWTLFALGEEFVFRGYLMNRIADLVGRTRSGWGVALVLASAIFGLSHFMQGITGVSENLIDGVVLGALYLKCGRKLAVPIIAHGVTDTVDFLLIFFHHYPGLR